MPDQENLVEVVFPTNGIDLTSEFGAQPPATTPTANNVRGFEMLTQRDRGGSRPGLVKFIDQQLPLS